MTENTKLLKILVIVLGVVMLLLLWQYIDRFAKYKKLQESSKQIQLYMEAEKDSLTAHLIDMKDKYETLKTDNDSMNFKLELQQAKIDQLLKLRADNLYVISRYKKEIGTLREVLRSYVVQVDSLLRIKQELQAENKEVKTLLTKSEASNKQLQEEKKHLSSKVQIAEALTAKNIVTVGLNSKGKERVDADKVVKLKTCFTIRENNVSQAGDKTIYMQINRPDHIILTQSEDNYVKYNGSTFVYSAKRDVNYQNVDVDLCIFYDTEEGELVEGNYELTLFSEGNIIGKSIFTLRGSKGLFKK
jgi:hypothetical protein